MLNEIAWQTFWLAIMTVFVLYYSVIYWFYFRGNAISFYPKNPAVFESGAGMSRVQEEDIIVNACLDEINAFFEEKKKCRTVRADVLNGLQHIFQKYPSIKGSYQEAIQKVIATQCANSCGIQIDCDDIGKMWLGIKKSLFPWEVL